MLTFKRKPLPLVNEKPDKDKRVESGLVKRCGVCWRIWDADAFTNEEGQVGTEERCPQCVDTRTPLWKADTFAEETEYAVSREPEPQDSIAQLKSTFPGSITRITDSNATRVYDGAPFRLIKSVARTLLLTGRSFSSSDTITGSTGLTVTVLLRSDTLTSLSITADSAMASGDHYSLTFNNVVFRNIFSVR